jgi:hypothetical protein
VRNLVKVCGVLAIACTTACGGDGAAGPPEPGDTDIVLQLLGLQPLDQAVDGHYEAWAIGSDGTSRSAGHFVPGTGSITVSSPIQNPAKLLITIEPPGDADGQPSASELLGGDFQGGTATLSIVRYVTGVSELEDEPGHHALFTPSNRFELGFPSIEDAGLWAFAPDPTKTTHRNYYLRLTPLRAGWTYEGWIVHEYGSPSECWVSYGKFLPDQFRLVNTRDDTGLGPFSGQVDYVNAMPIEVDMPGDDWVSNIHDMPVPCGLTLPFDLNGDAGAGIPSSWTHVITIEPMFNKGEPVLSERPFVLQPYRNPFGQGPPNEGRSVEYHPEFVPSGTATIQR